MEDSDNLREKRVGVLDAVGFVDDDVLPAESLDGRLLAETYLIRRNEDVEVARQDVLLDDGVALLFGALKDDDLEVWAPLGELSRPVVERGLWNADEVVA